MRNSPEHQTETDAARQAYMRMVRRMIEDGTYDEDCRLPYVVKCLTEKFSLDTLAPIC